MSNVSSSWIISWWWSHELLQLIDPQIWQGASPARYISHSIREDLQGIDVLRGPWIKTNPEEVNERRGGSCLGDPCRYPQWRGLEMDANRYTDMPPESHLVVKTKTHRHDYHDWNSHVSCVFFWISHWWITGTTRLPPARTETAHAFSGHRSLKRWHPLTNDPYHPMVLSLNVNSIPIWSIPSMSISPHKWHSW